MVLAHYSILVLRNCGGIKGFVDKVVADTYVHIISNISYNVHMHIESHTNIRTYTP